MTAKNNTQVAFDAWCAAQACTDTARDAYNRARLVLEQEYHARFMDECAALSSVWNKDPRSWRPSRVLAGQHEAVIYISMFDRPPFDYLVSWTVTQRDGRKHTSHTGETSSVALAVEAVETKLAEIRARENVAKIAACGHPRDGIIDGVCPWCKLKEVPDVR